MWLGIGFLLRMREKLDSNQRLLMKHRIDALFLKTEVMASQLLQSQMDLRP
jgi:hypothetical protein